MTVYRSRHALAGPFTADRIADLRLPMARRGYRVEDVDALLHRITYELGERSRRLDLVREENRRLKQALRSWQADCAATRQRQ
jgi:DivIVA domain-containing protein